MPPRRRGGGVQRDSLKVTDDIDQNFPDRQDIILIAERGKGMWSPGIQSSRRTSFLDAPRAPFHGPRGSSAGHQQP